jgi:cytoskeletal protein RodZ
LNIKKQYLIAIEEGRIESMPGKTYALGYLKLYSKFLGIDLSLFATPSSHPSKAQIKIEVDRGHKKYLFIFSMIMLGIVIFTYNWFSSVSSSKDQRSWIENTGYRYAE